MALRRREGARSRPRGDRELGGQMVRAAVIGAITLVLGFIFIQFIAQAYSILLIIFAGVAIGAALGPVVDWLSRRGIPRIVSVLSIYLLGFGGVGLFLFYALVPLGRQAIELASDAPQLLNRFQAMLDQLDQFAREQGVNVDFDQLFRNALSNVTGAAGFILRVPFALVSIIIGLFTALIISIYWVLVQHRVADTVAALVPASRRTEVRDTFADMGYRVGGYVRAVFILGVVVGLISYPALLLLQVDSPLLLAVAAAMGELILFFGPWLAGIPAVLVALTDSPLKAAAVAGLYIGIQQLESYVLAPLIQGRAVHIPPMVIVVALIIGGVLAGALGAILAIPLFVALWVPVERILIPSVRRWADRR